MCIRDRFLLMCLGIFAGIFAAALAVEKLWLKPEKQSPARRAAYVGIFAAIAALLMYIEFPLPFAPGFYELDFSEIPVLICSFSLGPVAGAGEKRSGTGRQRRPYRTRRC